MSVSVSLAASSKETIASTSVGVNDQSNYYNYTNDESVITNLLKYEYPNDKAHFENINLTPNLKNFIVKCGSCQPKGPFPKDGKNRSFSSTYYKTVATTGQTLPIKWLNYSKEMNCAYCMPCWLFSGGESKYGWASGISDWQGLSKKIKVHGNSQQHISSCLVFHQWKMSTKVDDSLETERRAQAQFWAQVLQRLFDITLMLAKNSLAFRGSKEHSGNYDGNFLSMVQLLSKYDTVMAQVINLPKGHIKYLSHDIQNQVIHCISSKLQGELLKKIKTAPFYSLIIDTTQDLSKKDQLSFVVRYTSITEVGELEVVDVRRKIKIEEVFLGFLHLQDQTASGILTLVLNNLKELGLDINKCRGQGYDGAAVMSGVYEGVQKKLQEIEELAVYVHCAAHNLNLVINDAVGSVQEVSNYFSILQDIYMYFGHSINRWDILSSLTGESVVTLKKLNPTRWASRHQSILAFKLRYDDVLKSLRLISLTSKKKDERSDANRLLKLIDNFQFVFLTVILSKIFSQINISSILLQGKETDLQKAVDTLQNSKETLQKMRNQYLVLKEEATVIAEQCKIDPVFPQKRQSKVKKYFDELARDHRFSDRDTLFKVKVFNSLLDVVTNQISNRFSALEKVVEDFSVLFPTVLIELTEEEILDKAGKLQKKYKKDIGPSLPVELISLRNGLKNQVSKLKTVLELANLLCIDFDIIAPTYPEVSTALFLFMTIPVSVASAERSFSTLKRIKSYLRCSMGQERLGDLGLLAINHEKAAALNTHELTKEFVDMKSRKKDFFKRFNLILM